MLMMLCKFGKIINAEVIGIDDVIRKEFKMLYLVTNCVYIFNSYLYFDDSNLNTVFYLSEDSIRY